MALAPKRLRGVTAKRIDGEVKYTSTPSIHKIGHKNINLTSDRGYTRVPKGKETLWNEEDFIAYREKRPRDEKGKYIRKSEAQVTISMRDEYGRWVKRQIPVSAYNEAVRYYKALRTKRLPGGGVYAAKMKNAVSATLSGMNDPLHARLVAIHEAEGLYKILIANGMYDEARRVLEAIDGGNINDIAYTTYIITKDWDKMKWEEMLRYRQNNDEFEAVMEAMENIA